MFESKLIKLLVQFFRMQFLSLNAYDRHKMLVNEYLLSYAGSSETVLKRDTSKDKTDMDVVREHHKVSHL